MAGRAALVSILILIALVVWFPGPRARRSSDDLVPRFDSEGETLFLAGDGSRGARVERSGAMCLLKTRFGPRKSSKYASLWRAAPAQHRSVRAAPLVVRVEAWRQRSKAAAPARATPPSRSVRPALRPRA